MGAAVAEFGCPGAAGSVVAGPVFGALAWAVFYVVTLQEERVMAARYHGAFADYMASVPRFLPNPRLWHDKPTLTIMPPKILRTFADAMLFLLSVPIAEGFEQLQNAGVLPVLFRLP